MGVHAGRKPQARPDIKWMDKAACHGIINFVNLPEEGGWTDRARITTCTGLAQKGNEKVRVGPTCPVINECLEYAMSLPKTDLQHRGLVFGGMTGQQIAKKRRKGAA